MFTLLRKHTQTVCWLIVIAIILWGGSSLLLGGSKRTSYVGTIFGQKVSHKTYNNTSKMVNLFTDPDTLRQASFDEQVWMHLVLLHEAEQRQIEPSNAMVKQQIAQLFGGEDFDYARYKNFVTNNLKESPRNFEEIVRDYIKIQQVIQQESLRFFEVTDSEVEEEYQKGNTQIRGEYLLLKLEDEISEWEMMPDRESFWQTKKDDGSVQTTEPLRLAELIQKHSLFPPLAIPLLDLEPGDFSKPIKSDTETFIFRVLEKLPPKEAISEEDREAYRKQIQNYKRSVSIQEWMTQMVEEADIQRF